jgi:hypothetical protein
MGHTAALTRTAIVTRAAAVEGLRKICGPRLGNDAAKLFSDTIAKQSLLASERNRRLKKTVGKMLDGLLAARNANVFFNQQVIRLAVFVTKRPIFSVAIVGSGSEIPIAEAQADAAPYVGAAAGDAQAAHPEKKLVGRGGIRFLEIVDEPISVVFAASESGLDGTGFPQKFLSPIAGT